MRHRVARKLRHSCSQPSPCASSSRLRNLPSSVLLLSRCHHNDIPRVTSLLDDRLTLQQRALTVKILCSQKISTAEKFIDCLSFPTPTIMSIIVSAWMRNGNAKACLRTGLNLIDRGVLPTRNVLTTLIRAAGLCKSNSALQRLWHLKGTCGLVADSRLHGAFIVAKSRIGTLDFERVRSMLTHSPIAIDHYTYSALIHSLSLVSPSPSSSSQHTALHAETLFAEMVTGGIAASTTAMNVLINTLCKCGKVARAHRFLRQYCTRISPDLFSFSPLLHGYGVQGNFKLCSALVAHMVQIGIVPNGVVLSSIFSNLKRHGHPSCLIWQTYNLVSQTHPDHIWDKLAQNILVQSIGQAKSSTGSALDIVRQNYAITQSVPCRQQVTPLLDLAPSLMPLIISEFGPDRIALRQSLMSSIKDDRIDLCRRIISIFISHRTTMDSATTAALLTYLIMKFARYPADHTLCQMVFYLHQKGIMFRPSAAHSFLISPSPWVSAETGDENDLRSLALIAAIMKYKSVTFRLVPSIANLSLDNVLLRIFSSFNDFPACQALLGISPHLCTEPILLDVYRRTNSMPEIDQFLFTLKRRSSLCRIQGNQFNRLIFHLACLGHIRRSLDAISYWGYGHKGSLSACSVNAVLALLCRNNLRELLEPTIRASGAIPDLCTYNILIDAQCRAGDFAAAERLRASLQLAGFFPDTVTFNILISGSYRHRRRKQGLRLYQEMKESSVLIDATTLKYVLMLSGDDSSALTEIKSISYPILPTSSLISIIIRKYGRSGIVFIRQNWPETVIAAAASDAFKERIFGVLSEVSINADKSSAGVDGRSRLNCEYISRCINRIVLQSALSTSQQYEMLMITLARDTVRTESAVWLFNYMLRHGIPASPGCCAALMDALARQGNVKSCEQLMTWAKNEMLPISEAMYTAMMKAYARLGDLNSCRILLDEMRQCSVCPTIHTINALLFACRIKNNVSLGHVLLSVMIQLKLSPSLVTFHELLRLYASQGLVDCCDDLIRYMESTPNTYPDDIAYSLQRRSYEVRFGTSADPASAIKIAVS